MTDTPEPIIDAPGFLIVGMKAGVLSKRFPSDTPELGVQVKVGRLGRHPDEDAYLPAELAPLGQSHHMEHGMDEDQDLLRALARQALHDAVTHEVDEWLAREWGDPTLNPHRLEYVGKDARKHAEAAKVRWWQANHRGPYDPAWDRREDG